MPITGRLPPAGKYANVQSVIFSYDHSLRKAKRWLKERGLYYDAPDFTKYYIRFRQWDPIEGHEYRFVWLDRAETKAIVLRIK